MSLIGWIVLGLIAGFIASKIVNKAGEGALLDIILGVIGAVVGGWLFHTFGMPGVTGFQPLQHAGRDTGCGGRPRALPHDRREARHTPLVIWSAGSGGLFKIAVEPVHQPVVEIRHVLRLDQVVPLVRVDDE